MMEAGDRGYRRLPAAHHRPGCASTRCRPWTRCPPARDAAGARPRGRAVCEGRPRQAPRRDAGQTTGVTTQGSVLQRANEARPGGRPSARAACASDSDGLDSGKKRHHICFEAPSLLAIAPSRATGTLSPLDLRPECRAYGHLFV